MAEINTTDERVLSLSLPWCQVFDREATKLIVDALWRAAHAMLVYDSVTPYTAGQQQTIHEVRQILRMIQLIRPYHEDSMRAHEGEVFTTRGEWRPASG